jgi:hypothetical protein
MSVFFIFFSIALFLVLFNTFFSIHQIIVHNNDFSWVTPSYLYKIFISFKTFIFFSVLCRLRFSFSYMLFCLLIFFSHFFPISWHSILYAWVPKSQKKKKWQHNQWCKCNTRNRANITNVNPVSMWFSTDTTAYTWNCWCSMRTSLLTYYRSWRKQMLQFVFVPWQVSSATTQRKMQDMNAHTIRCFTAHLHGEPTHQAKPKRMWIISITKAIHMLCRVKWTR